MRLGGLISKEPEPVPCRMCSNPIYPDMDFCNDECERAYIDEMNRDEINQAEMARWVQENGESGHG